MVHEVFDRLHYVPLSREVFQTVETVILTHRMFSIIWMETVDYETSFSREIPIIKFVPYHCYSQTFVDYHTPETGNVFVMLISFENK